MKQDTKETIGSRGTVQGFRPLIREERWHRDDMPSWMLRGGLRPYLDGEVLRLNDPAWDSFHYAQTIFGLAGDLPSRNPPWFFATKEPLPPPQVETFEAHGYVWYRHVPGEACPVEPDVVVDFIWRLEAKREKVVPAPQKAKFIEWGSKNYMEDEEIIGYRFPDFPAVHTPAQQEQHVEKTEQSFQHDTTKQRLATMYHGWCDVAPDSVAECIADVARVLYPTDAERCEAAFEAWLDQRGHPGMDVGAASEAWDAAWSAAKQEKL